MNFCCLSDINYLSRFLILYESAIKFNSHTKFFVLALDSRIFKLLKEKKLENVKIVKLSVVERKYKYLKIAKKNRSLIEYYFTLSSFFIKYIRSTFNIIHCYYIDSDIIFVRDFKKENHRYLNHSIVIIKQNWKEKFGKFNVGLIFFNFKFKETSKILNRWSKECFDWCYDKCEEGKYADQKYLDQWPNQTRHLLIIEPENSVMAPWDLKKDNIPLLARERKTFYAYHYHDLEIINHKFFSTGICKYHKIKSRNSIKKFYNDNIVKNLLKKNQLLNTTSKSVRLKSYISNKLFMLFLLKIRFLKKKFLQITKFDFFKIV